MVSFISALILGNLLLIFWFASKSVKFIFIKYNRRVRRFFDPNYMKKVNEPEPEPLKPNVSILERHRRYQNTVGLPEIIEARESEELDKKKKIKPLTAMRADLKKLQRDYKEKSFKDFRKEWVIK